VQTPDRDATVKTVASVNTSLFVFLASTHRFLSFVQYTQYTHNFLCICSNGRAVCIALSDVTRLNDAKPPIIEDGSENNFRKRNSCFSLLLWRSPNPDISASLLFSLFLSPLSSSAPPPGSFPSAVGTLSYSVPLSPLRLRE
jgi:hypothetical protein